PRSSVQRARAGGVTERYLIRRDVAQPGIQLEVPLQAPEGRREWFEGVDGTAAGQHRSGKQAHVPAIGADIDKGPGLRQRAPQNRIEDMLVHAGVIDPAFDLVLEIELHLKAGL